MSAMPIDDPVVIVVEKPTRWARLKNKAKALFARMRARVRSWFGGVTSDSNGVRVRAGRFWTWLKTGPIGSAIKAGFKWTGSLFGKAIAVTGAVVFAAWAWLANLGVVLWTIGAIAVGVTFLWNGFNDYVLGIPRYLWRKDKTMTFRDIRMARRAQATRPATPTTTPGDITVPTTPVEPVLPDIEEITAGFASHYREGTRLSLETKANRVVLDDMERPETTLPGVLVAGAPEAVEQNPDLLYHTGAMNITNNPVLMAMDAWVNADRDHHFEVDFDFSPYVNGNQHRLRELMEVLVLMQDGSMSKQERSYWTGRVAALSAYEKQKDMLNQHGRWWALLNVKLRNQPNYHLSKVRAGFMDMINELQKQHTKTTARAR